MNDDLQIRELVARYADAVTRRDEKAWGATWAEDASWTLMGRTTHGRDAIVSLWKQLMGGLSFVTQIPTHGIVHAQADRATARWYITEYGKLEAAGALFTLGVYHDVYRREPAGWRFADRRFDMMYSGPPDLSADLRPFPPDAPALEE